MTNRVLILTGAYLPGYRAGGPIQSVANMVAKLRDQIRFSIVTSSWDHGADGPYPNVPEGRWLQQDGVRTLYIAPGRAGLSQLLRLVLTEPADVIYFNSLLDPRFTLLPLSVVHVRPRRPVIVVAPRGMLGPGALQQKRLKKAVFLRLSRRLGLYRGVRFHATTAAEADLVRTHFGPDARALVAGNLAAPSGPGSGTPRPPKMPGQARFFFLSRVSPKKNLELALAALARIPASDQVQFRVFGPADDPGYLACLKAKVPPAWHAGVRFEGPVPHPQVAAAIRNQHFLILPTLDENYGHAIVESLQHGRPVVISQHTPWHGLQQANAGWDLPLDRDRWTQVLQTCIAMDQGTYDRMSASATAFAARIIQNDEALQATRRLLSP